MDPGAAVGLKFGFCVDFVTLGCAGFDLAFLVAGAEVTAGMMSVVVLRFFLGGDAGGSGT